jgi:hypothetical protein
VCCPNAGEAPAQDDNTRPHVRHVATLGKRHRVAVTRSG